MRYATRWDFPEIKELAIQYLETHEMDTVTRINLYQENCFPEKYLFPLYVHLASREELLGFEESQALGIETLVLIQQAREHLRARPPMKNCLLSPIRSNLAEMDIFEIVSATLNISLEEVGLNIGGNVSHSFFRYLRSGSCVSCFVFRPREPIWVWYHWKKRWWRLRCR